MKKAEISSSFLIKLVLLLVGFGILVYAVVGFVSPGNIDRTACHQSVILRGTISEGLVMDQLKNIPNLQCETKKLCITDKIFGDDCSYSGKSGKDYVIERISGDKDKKQEALKRIVSREIAECWHIMAEGKLQIFTRPFMFSESQCVICTQVEFGENIQKEFKNINGVVKYMVEHKVPGKEVSYYEFLYGTKTPEIYDKENDFLTTKKKAIVFYENSTNKFASATYTVLFAAMSTAVGAKAGATTGGLIGSVVIPIPGVGTATGGIIGAGIGAGFGIFVGDKFGSEAEDALRAGKPKYSSGYLFVDYDIQSLRDLQCTSFESI